jgi:hypothetical protein
LLVCLVVVVVVEVWRWMDRSEIMNLGEAVYIFRMCSEVVRWASSLTYGNTPAPHIYASSGKPTSHELAISMRDLQGERKRGAHLHFAASTN